jgi:hypothetical protein
MPAKTRALPLTLNRADDAGISSVVIPSVWLGFYIIAAIHCLVSSHEVEARTNISVAETISDPGDSR